MRRFGSHIALASSFLVTACALGCNGKVVGFDHRPSGATGTAGNAGDPTTSVDGGASGSGGNGGDDSVWSPDPGPVPHADKVDLLLMVDNSQGMNAKQQLLAQSLPKLLGWLLHPPCVDANGKPAAAGPTCPPGTSTPFPAVTDLHVGVISSSLGGHGADSCSPAQIDYDPTKEDMSHLLTRGSGGAVPTWNGTGFLAWDPHQALSPPGLADEAELGARLSSIVTGAGKKGCGFESQLEAVYRFLVDPEPYQSIAVDQGQASSLVGTDTTVLSQRAAFLRPDSLLVILSLSDEDDCSVRDGGQYYLALQATMGASQFFLPRATSACLTNPNDPCCTSCGAPTQGCPDPQSDPECQKPSPSVDKDQALNLRCFDQKRRFGIDFLQPVSRYVDALTKRHVPDRAGNPVANPIYADLQGTGKPARHPGLVLWANLGGVPWQDLAVDPHDASKGFLSSDELASQARWPALVGDRAANVPPGDPFMLGSIDPRGGANPFSGDAILPPGPQNNAINGHESDFSARRDLLQYACTFALAAPQACDPLSGCPCTDGDVTMSPLCETQAGTFDTTQQHAAGATPGTRQLEVVRALGSQGIAGSVCAAQVTDAGALDYGYVPTLAAVLSRAIPALR